MRRLLSSTLLVTGFSFLGVVLQFALQVVLASKFGAGQEMDAYLAATAIPTWISSVYVGALGFAYLPVFVERLTSGRVREAWGMTSRLFDLTVLALGLVSLSGISLAGQIMHLTAPGFAPGMLLLSASLARILWAAIPFTGAATLFAALYQSQNRFGWPAAALVLNYATTLAVTLWLGPVVGIRAVAIGTLAGSIAQFLILSPSLFGASRYSPGFRYGLQEVHGVARLMLPLLIGGIFYRVINVAERYFASSLPIGSI